MPTPEQIKKASCDLGEIVATKNEAYGAAFSLVPQLLQHLYPNGIKPAQYQDTLLMCRILDKCCRIATDVKTSGEDAYLDIAGYGILGHLSHVPVQLEEHHEQDDKDVDCGPHSDSFNTKLRSRGIKQDTRIGQLAAALDAARDANN